MPLITLQLIPAPTNTSIITLEKISDARYTLACENLPNPIDLAIIDHVKITLTHFFALITKSPENTLSFTDPIYLKITSVATSKKTAQSDIVLIHSDKAWQQFLENAHTQLNPTKTLVINTQADPKLKQRFLGKDLVRSPSEIFSPPLVAGNLSKLRTLSFTLTSHAKDILKQCQTILGSSVKTLQSVDLLFSPSCQPILDLETKQFSLNISNVNLCKALEDIYSLNLSQWEELTHLGATLWGKNNTRFILTTLATLPKLKTLILDIVLPDTSIQNGIPSPTKKYIAKNNHSTGSLLTKHQHMLLPNPKKPNAYVTKLVANLKILSLNRVELYEWETQGTPPRCAIDLFNHLIESDALEQLTDIVFRPHPSYTDENDTPLVKENAKSTLSVLNAVIEKNLPIKTLILLTPEIHGYQPWLNNIKKGNFAGLSTLHYRLPDAKEGEAPKEYMNRMNEALQTLLKAINRKKTPVLQEVHITSKWLTDPDFIDEFVDLRQQIADIYTAVQKLCDTPR